MRLPCKHIFAVHKLEALQLFDTKLYAERWSKSFLRETFKLFLNGEVNQSLDITLQEPWRKKILSQNAKFNESDKICKRLSYLASMEGPTAYQRKMGVLRKLLSFWESSKEADVIELNQKGMKINYHY